MMDGAGEDIFEESIDTVRRYGECVLKDIDNSSEDDFNGLLSIMKYLCDAKEKYEIRQSIFNEYVESIRENNHEAHEDNVKNLLGDYKSELEKSYENLKLGENNEVYQKFKAMLLNKRSKSHDDSEIETVSQTVNTIDPITRLPLKDPVKNVKCGHSYEKSAILKLISTKKIVKCPIPGCITAECVKINDLVDDVELKRYIEKMQNSLHA